jgi:hypothetical protein
MSLGTRFAFCWQPVCLSLLLVGLSRAATAQEVVEPPLPMLEDLQVPEYEQLLTERPVDWIVTTLDQRVLFVDPVQPRPGTLADLAAKHEASLKWPKPRNRDEQREQTEKRALLQRLQISLWDAPGDSDYLIETRVIERIIYFEDLILQRINLLLDQNDTVRAYELLTLIDRRQRGWPGSDKALERFHFVEAGVKLAADRPEDALRSLEALFALNPKYEGLPQRAGEAVNLLVQRAVDMGDFRTARHFLARLTRILAEHPVFQSWRSELLSRTRTEMEAASALARMDPLAAAHLVDAAARIWPETPGLRELHRSLFDLAQFLKVGVLTFPGASPAYPFPTRADLRTRELTELRLFEPGRVDESNVRYRSAVCEEWEPTDLGRELRLNLRGRRAPWESRPGITSLELQQTLEQRLNPDGPDFDERIAALVTGVEARSPWEIVISFRQPPLRPESLLALPLRAPPGDSELAADLIDGVRRQMSQSRSTLASRFQLERRDPDNLSLLRVREANLQSKQRYLTEIAEHKYDSWERSLQALLRGEMDVLPYARLADVQLLRADGRFFTVPAALPETQLLQIHPASPAMQNGPLRRALLAALPREQLLRDFVLKDADPAWGRLTTAPFPIASFAYNRVLAQPVNNPLLAASLLLTAKKELGVEVVHLRLAHPGDPDIRRLCDELVLSWKRVGIEVELLDPQNPSGPQPWDLAFRTLQLADPAAELWPLIAATERPGVSSLAPLPDRLRQSLLSLEQAGDWPTATGLMHQLQVDMLAEARWIPLWEIDQFWIARRRLGGVPSPLLSPYHNAEKWVVQSWYPQETP